MNAILSVKPGTKETIKTAAKWIGGILAVGAAGYAVNQAVRGPEGNVFARMGDDIASEGGLIVAGAGIVAVSKGVQAAVQPGATVVGVLKDASYGALQGAGIGIAANVVASGAGFMLSDNGPGGVSL